MKKLSHPKKKKWIWWKHGVIYHIYPRSFYDSNDDGIGDIEGIIHKLNYLKDLGVDAIWLSPVNKSPQVDFGYDVSDYRSIDPDFGTINDFKCLLKEAHKKKIRIIMDLIMNHTSNQHPWFVMSASSQSNSKRDWYIWKEGINGKAPNNWKTCFGGSAWEYHKESGQYYYHSFFKEQPDLNWRNKELKKEFFEIVDYWLKMGVDGFRLDVANLIIKDKKFRNNPGFLRGFKNKQKIYTRNRPRSIKTLKELRRLIDRYKDRMVVGEIYTLPPGDPKLAASYLGSGKNSLNLAFDFSLLFKSWNAKKYAQAIERWNDTIPEKGWPCNVLSNHDLLRSYNREKWRRYKKQKAIVSAFLLLTMRGTPFIYYGEEIGMQNTRLSRNKIKDPLGKLFWPIYTGRDKARSPMQWSSEKNGGFSETRPWLPLNLNYKKVNVEAQNGLRESLFWFYRKLIKLRKKYCSLHAGNWELLLDGSKGVLCYLRSTKSQTIIVYLNFKARTQLAEIEEFKHFSAQILLSNSRKKRDRISPARIKLAPFEASVALVI